MDIVGVAEVVSAVAVLVGFGFAANELRQHRIRKARESALALVNSYQTPDFAVAIVLITELEEGLLQRQLQQRVGEDMKLIALLMTTWESLGILVCRGEVGLDLVDDFFSGAIVLSWRKLQPFVQEMRDREDRQTYFEWFQWLSERMLERESTSPPIPAHIEYRDWQERR